MIALSITACLVMMVGVGLGAFGAHALRSRIDGEKLKTYQTGTQYHLIHGLAIFVAGMVAGQSALPSLAAAAGWLFLAGVVLFSGSLYGLATGRIGGRLGVLTPLGGLCFIVGWGLLATSLMA